MVQRVASIPGLLLVFLAGCASGPVLRRDAVALPPGVIIAHSPAASGRYIGSPGLIILADGSYLAKCDEFGPYLEASAGARAVTRLFSSRDRGASWQPLAAIEGLFWASLFTHRGALYLMGTDGPYGDAVILRSRDGGASWTEPLDEHSGRLLEGGGYHCAPVPVLAYSGRIWRAMEDSRGPGGWAEHFRAFAMSAPLDSDLLEAASWTCSGPLESDTTWLGGEFRGWLEGNVILTPEGEVADILRIDTLRAGGVAALVRIGVHGRTTSFDPARDFLHLPGGCKKFTIRRDECSGLYWSLVDLIPPRHSGGVPGRIRNTLALVSSPDLRRWKVRAIVLYHPDVERHAFQYLDWCFEGEDIIAVSRTAFDDGSGGAHSYHDANYLTFHRIRGFRSLDLEEGFRALVSARFLAPLRRLGTCVRGR